KTKGDEKNAEAINFEFAVAACGFDFARKFGRIGDETLREQHRNDADGNVDEEDPAPAPVVSNPAPERRADDGRRDDGHAVKGEGCGTLLRREDVNENCLFNGSETTAANSLHHAK